MKTKTKKPAFYMDERNKQIACKVISIMYFLTIFAIVGIVLYREFVLGQEIDEFEDIAIVMTVNSLFLIAALLYFGAIPIQKLKIKSILLIYIVFVVAGSIFTYFNYNVFKKAGLTWEQLFDKFIIILVITGLILGFWILLSVLDKKRLEKELE